MSWLNILGCTITLVGCTVYGYVRQVRLWRTTCPCIELRCSATSGAPAILATMRLYSTLDALDVQYCVAFPRCLVAVSLVLRWQVLGQKAAQDPIPPKEAEQQPLINSPKSGP